MERKIKMTKQERKRAHGEGAGAQGESKREQKKSKQEEPVAFKANCCIVRQSKNKDGTQRVSGTAFYRIRKDKLIKNENRSKSNEFSPVGKVVNDPQCETQERGWNTFDEAWREITRFQETFAPDKYGQQAMYQIFMHFHAGNTAPITFGDSTGFATKEEAEALGDVRRRDPDQADRRSERLRRRRCERHRRRHDEGRRRRRTGRPQRAGPCSRRSAGRPTSERRKE